MAARWKVSDLRGGVGAMEEYDLSKLDRQLVRLFYLFPLVVWGLLIYFALA